MLRNFQTIILEGVLTLDTAAYAAGDVLSDTLALALPIGMPQDNPAALRAEIVSLRVLDEDDQGQAMDIVFLRANKSLGTKNAAVSISDADARDIVGHVAVSAYIDLINSQQAQPVITRPIPVELPAAVLYVSAICRGGTPTHTASGVRVQVGLRIQNKEVA